MTTTAIQPEKLAKPTKNGVGTVQDVNTTGEINASSYALTQSSSSNFKGFPIVIPLIGTKKKEDNSFTTTTDSIAVLNGMASISAPADIVLNNNDSLDPYHRQGQKRSITLTMKKESPIVPNYQNCGEKSVNGTNLQNKRPKKSGNGNRDDKNDSDCIAKIKHVKGFPEFEVEDRVFCRWPRNELWYWGIILSKFKRRKSHFYRYEVQFDDGDILKGISAKYIISEDRYRDIFKEPEKAANVYNLISSTAKAGSEGKRITSILHEVKEEDLIHTCDTSKLYLLRCNRCEQCLKPICQQCVSCKRNKSRIQKKHFQAPMECCFKKMCCEVPDVLKAQKAEGFPHGYSFIFFPKQKNPKYEGLAIFTPNGEMFKSVQSIIGMPCTTNPAINPHLELHFYNFVGLSPSSYTASINYVEIIDSDVSNNTKTTASAEERPHKSTLAGNFPLPSCSSFKTKAKAPQINKKLGNNNDYASFEATKTKNSSKTTKFSTKDLFQKRCHICSNCRKPNCKLCDTCSRNERRTDSDPNIECCLQKMCVKISIEQKQQEASPIFPSGWYFYFDLHKSKNTSLIKYQGLVIKSKKTTPYRSVEAAMKHNYKSLGTILDLCEKFYKFVGLQFGDDEDANMANGLLSSSPLNCNNIDKQNISQTIQKRKSRKVQGKKEEMTTKKGNKNGCVRKKSNKHKNINSYPDEKVVGARVYSKFSNEQWYWGSILSIRNGGGNTRYSILFDDGDFETVPSSRISTQREYVRVFKVEPPRKPGDKKIISDDLIESKTTSNITNIYVNAAPTTTTLSPSIKKDEAIILSEKSEGTMIDDEKSNTISFTNDGAKKVPNAISLTPKELYKLRCKTCSMCMKKNCEKCTCCIHNATRTRSYREVCLQKICRKISDDVKAQPAVGFPEDWKFYFGDPNDFAYTFRTRQKAQYPYLLGLVLLSPSGKKYTSPDKACMHYNKMFTSPEALKRSFYGHVGINSVVLDEDENSTTNLLIGHGICQEWTNVNGQKMILFGKVAHCEIEYGFRRYMIKYDEESRKSVNSISTGCDTFVPQNEMYVDTISWGSCILYEEKVSETKYMAKQEGDKRKASNPTIFDILSAAGKLPYYISWIAPDMRVEDHQMISIDGRWERLPRVTVFVKGYKLIFSAQKSGIPNAGFGVFVRCISLKNVHEKEKKKTKNSDLLTLNAGELIDLGIYAPFRKKDRKEEHIFLLKNFIFSLNCEEWCFDTRDDCQMFDVTDDFTGEIHDIAKNHLPAYVNETDGIQFPTIRAEFDPEGAVHYLLGHAEEHYGKLQLSADGVTETELFIDYGSRYENVRIRKGYSRLSKKEQEIAIQHCAKDEAEYVLEIKDYSATEIDEGIRFLNQHFLFHEGGSHNKTSMNSILVSSLIVHERAMIIALCLKIRAKSIQEEFKNLDRIKGSRCKSDTMGVNTDSSEKNNKDNFNDNLCDNGVSVLDMDQVIDSANQLVIYLGSLYENDNKMKESLLSNAFFVQVLESMLVSKDGEKTNDPTFNTKSPINNINSSICTNKNTIYINHPSDKNNHRLNDSNTFVKLPIGSTSSNDQTNNDARSAGTKSNVNSSCVSSINNKYDDEKKLNTNNITLARNNLNDSNTFVKLPIGSTSSDDQTNNDAKSAGTKSNVNSSFVSSISTKCDDEKKLNTNNITLARNNFNKCNIRNWSAQEFSRFIYEK